MERYFAPGYEHLNQQKLNDEHVFSAMDIVAYATLPGRKTYTLGSLTTVAISAHTDKFPVTSLGKKKIKGFTEGHSMYAGTLVFSSFDRLVWHKMMVSERNLQKDLANNPSFSSRAKNRKIETFTPDNLPLFDINITMANEFGAVSYTALTGVTIVDMGVTYSTDSIVLMESYSYMAMDLIPFQPFEVHPANINISSLEENNNISEGFSDLLNINQDVFDFLGQIRVQRT